MRSHSLLAMFTVTVAAVVSASEARANITQEQAQTCITTKANATGFGGGQEGSVIPVPLSGTPTGWYADFNTHNASIYIPATGPCSAAHVVMGDNNGDYKSIGVGSSGPEGWPVTDEKEAPGGDGRYNYFQNGTVWYHNGQAHSEAVWGQINSKYNWLDAVAGPLGYPTSNPQPWNYCAYGDCFTGQATAFENGWIAWAQNLGNSWQTDTFPILWNVASSSNVYVSVVQRYQDGMALNVTGYFTPGSTITLYINLKSGQWEVGNPTVADANGKVSWDPEEMTADCAAYCYNSSDCIVTFDLNDGSNQFATSSVNIFAL